MEIIQQPCYMDVCILITIVLHSIHLALCTYSDVTLISCRSRTLISSSQYVGKLIEGCIDYMRDLNEDGRFDGAS